MKIEAFFEPLLESGELLAQLRAKQVIAKKRLYFDWTASGLAFKPIESRLYKILAFYANTHSDSNIYAQKMELLYKEAKRHIKQSLELDSNFALIATGYGASGAIKRFQEIIGLYIPPRTRNRFEPSLQKDLPLVLVGPMEHHSNEVSFRESLCEVKRIPLDDNGLLDFCQLEEILIANKGREIIASFNVVSNVTGIEIDIQRLSSLIRSYGGLVALDMACCSPYYNIPCSCFDVAFFSPHKLLGGVGSCGLLAIRKEIVDNCLPPSFAGGGSVAYVSRKTQYYLDDIELREEAGTPPILQILRASLAYKLRNEISFAWIMQQEKRLIHYFAQLLDSIPSAKMYGDMNRKKIGIFAFNIDGLSPYYVSFLLSKRFHIDTRAGCSCAGPYAHDLLKMDDLDFIPAYKAGWVRVSLHYTHKESDIDRFFAALHKVGI